jgi:hypothetical protein
MAKYDDMSFGKAFAAARKEKGAGKTFTWKGSSYTTDQADDKKSSGGSSRDSVTERASRAIDRAEAERAPTMRPRSRPAGLGGEAPTVRPQARPEGLGTRNAPTATKVETPSVTTSELAPSGQRASGRTASTGGKVSRAQWDAMSRIERREAGLPTSVIGFMNYQRDVAGGSSGRRATRMAKGGMVKKSGYAKGGMVKANCGASMKPTQKGTKK